MSTAKLACPRCELTNACLAEREWLQIETALVEFSDLFQVCPTHARHSLNVGHVKETHMLLVSTVCKDHLTSVRS